MHSAQFQLHADIEQRHWWFTARREIMRHLVRQVLPPATTATVLDIGCGTGANIAALADEYRTIGIDTSSEAIALARRNQPNVEFIRGAAPDDLHGAMANVDCVMMMDVLEHVPDDLVLFSRILAESKPGAYFLLTVPADYALWSPHDESFGHYRRYDSQRFAAIWQGLPVRQLLLSHYNARLYPLVRLIRGVNRLRGKSSGAAGTDFSIPTAAVNRYCQRLFANEASRLTRVMSGQAKPYPRGVSLVAVLQRTAGEVRVRSKPPQMAADYFDPATGTYTPRAARGS